MATKDNAEKSIKMGKVNNILNLINTLLYVEEMVPNDEGKKIKTRVESRDKLAYASKRNFSSINEAADKYRTEYQRLIEDCGHQLAVVDEKDVPQKDPEGNYIISQKNMADYLKTTRAALDSFIEKEVTFKPFFSKDTGDGFTRVKDVDPFTRFQLHGILFETEEFPES